MRGTGCLALLATAAIGAAEDARARVDFVRDIQPIFRDACYTCHGPDKQRGGLRLDVRQDALRGGKHGPVILPRNAKNSPLYKRLVAHDPDERMPQKGEPLSLEKINLIRAWIEAGAPWPDRAADLSRHWAYQKPSLPSPPAVRNKHWPRSPLDHFILARLEREQLKPQPEADRYTLIRRVALDITGLPPTLEEVDQFVTDKSPDAYEKLVDRLLARPSYGEHWARMWLDLARYADSAGYADDPPRTIWLYRDWVIRAFNENKPFDQFTIEQIAGDLLPAPEEGQLIATAFHRNTMTNNEGGTTDEEWRNAAVVDRLNTTMAVWMGTSMACAQCHNHKYDPFTQKEYFELFAFFNNTEDADRPDEAPTLSRYSEQQQALRGRLEADIAALEKKFSRRPPSLSEGQAAWEQQMSAAPPTWSVLSPETFSSTGNVSLQKQPDDSLLLVGDAPAQATFTVRATTDLKSITAIRLEALADASLPANGPGRANNGNFVLSEFKLKLGRNQRKFAAASAEHSQEGYPVAAAIDGKDGDSGWAILPLSGKNHAALFALKTPLERDEPMMLTFELVHNSQFGQHILGRFRLSGTASPNPLGPQSLPQKIREALAAPAEQRSDLQREMIADYYARNLAPEFAPEREQLTELRKQLAEIKPVTVPILRELQGDARRKTKIQIRGNFLDTADEVQEAVPAVLHPLPSDAPRNRLSLARWLVDANNPLTARVMANRFWQEIFGVGIVPSSEEFGTRGEPPTHPELLDWLACEFQKDWDIKRFLKLLVTSATYRQSSRVTADRLAKDPDNRLLSRGPRVRLTAEMLRDQALFVSDLLSQKIGGPPVRPPRPSFGLTAAFGGALDWQPSKGEDRYRRALYTEWRRTSPYPSMATFDAPSREVCTLRRNRTNTPLQALVTLNDPVYVEAAQALARRMFALGGGQTETAAKTGFRLCLARPPTDAEWKRIVQLFQEARAELSTDPKKAQELASNPLGPLPDDADAVELAAWTAVANVLLNLDETVMKK